MPDDVDMIKAMILMSRARHRGHESAECLGTISCKDDTDDESYLFSRHHYKKFHVKYMICHPLY